MKLQEVPEATSEVTGKRIRDSAAAPHEDDDDSDSNMSDEWLDGVGHEFDPQEHAFSYRPQP